MVRKYMAPMRVTIRWSHFAIGSWILSEDISDPLSETALVSVDVPSGTKGYIHGIYIATPEANDFYLSFVNNGSEKRIYIYLPAKGTFYFSDIVPLNEGIPADPSSTISIKNINTGSGIYKAGVLVNFEPL